MGSNYTLMIRSLLGLVLIALGANQFVHFSATLDFTAELIGLEAGDLFYGAVFVLCGLLVLFKKALAVALIVVLFIFVQILTFYLTNNPKGILSPMGIMGLLVLLNVFDNRHRFKELFYS